MARKKPAKKAKKQAKKKMAPARKAGKKKVAKKSTAKRSATKKAAPKSAKRSAKPAAKAPASAKATAGKKPNLDRPRKTVADVRGIPSSLAAAGAATAASSGRQELKDRLRKHTGSGPALTSGDVDADWESAESIGDEAPGGDNPTPDQDVVDDIGRALGVEYDDDEELKGGAEIGERDRHRWELDPASKDKDEDDEE